MSFVKSAAMTTGLLVWTAGCAMRPPLPGASMATEPFVIERDLLGATVGRGAFKPIVGSKRWFTAYLDGAWDGQTLTLVENFEFDDGETDTKTWRLTKVSDGEFVGGREDTVGEARGFVDGDVFRLEYDLRLGDENGMVVRFRDIMFKRADGVVVNRASVGYWGLRIGSVNLEIKRAEP